MSYGECNDNDSTRVKSGKVEHLTNMFYAEAELSVSVSASFKNCKRKASTFS